MNLRLLAFECHKDKNFSGKILSTVIERKLGGPTYQTKGRFNKVDHTGNVGNSTIRLPHEGDNGCHEDANAKDNDNGDDDDDDDDDNQ